MVKMEEEKIKYAVATTLINKVSSGVVNVVTDLRFIKANNHHEAIGIAMEELSKEFKEHHVHIKPLAKACV